jgi:TRAP-type mannitol/chloroaromatic compound transport system permease large subunit
MKIDMLWFATLIAVNLQTAFLLPLVAIPIGDSQPPTT